MSPKWWPDLKIPHMFFPSLSLEDSKNLRRNFEEIAIWVRRLRPTAGTAGFVPIAAANSSSGAKARAMYVCEGANDHIIINQAIGDHANTGTEIKLLAGDFYLGGAIELDVPKITLSGFGRSSTLNSTTGGLFTNGMVYVTSPMCECREFRVVADAGNPGPAILIDTPEPTSAADETIVQNMLFAATKQGAIHALADTANVIILNNHFTLVSPTNTAALIKLTGVVGAMIGNNLMRAVDDEVPPDIYRGIELAGACRGVMIANNGIHNAQREGIRIDGGTDIQVLANIITNVGVAASNTYDAISIGDGADAALRVHAQGNSVGVKLLGTNATAFARYAARIGANSTDAFVTNNWFRGGFVTAAISDAGTGTITAPGNVI